MTKNDSLAENIEQKILDVLGREVMSTSQLAKNLDVTRYILAGYLEALRNQGKLELHKVGKSNVYTLSREVRGMEE